MASTPGVIVTHESTVKPLAEWSRKAPGPRGELSILELVNAVASGRLAGHFDDSYPGYPVFRGLREPISEASRPRMAALREAYPLAGRHAPQGGTAVLDGLGLLHDGQVRPRAARYASAVLERVEQIRPGEVLNRSALLVAEYAGVEREPASRLEPEWLAVTLLALVYSGDLVMQLPGERIDAGNLERAARLSLETLVDFRFVERPRDLPLAAWTAVFELLELSPGLLREPDRHDVAIETLQRQVEAEVARAVRGQESLRLGVLLWQESVLEPGRQSELSRQLGEYKTFLEGLRVFDNPGRLRREACATARPRCGNRSPTARRCTDWSG
jgi:hypothetical protein